MSAAIQKGAVVGVAEPKKKNRSFGSVHFSERDGMLLGLIGEQFAISVEQLARLNGTTVRTACNLRDRWSRAGWVESRQLTHFGPSMIWLTREGVRVTQSPYAAWQVNVGLGSHIEAVTNIRLLLERELRRGEWECERSLAQAAPWGARERPHLPDGVLDTGSQRIAIEVELTLKSRFRLAAIFAEISQDYTEVWYFAAASLRRTLTRLADEAPWPNITVYPYPPRPLDLLA